VNFAVKVTEINSKDAQLKQVDEYPEDSRLSNAALERLSEFELLHRFEHDPAKVLAVEKQLNNVCNR
jgi:hypothetical protein